jgi:hypothetical protein
MLRGLIMGMRAMAVRAVFPMPVRAMPKLTVWATMIVLVVAMAMMAAAVMMAAAAKLCLRLDLFRLLFGDDNRLVPTNNGRTSGNSCDQQAGVQHRQRHDQFGLIAECGIKRRNRLRGRID